MKNKVLLSQKYFLWLVNFEIISGVKKYNENLQKFFSRLKLFSVIFELCMEIMNHAQNASMSFTLISFDSSTHSTSFASVLFEAITFRVKVFSHTTINCFRHFVNAINACNRHNYHGHHSSTEKPPSCGTWKTKFSAN